MKLLKRSEVIVSGVFAYAKKDKETQKTTKEFGGLILTLAGGGEKTEKLFLTPYDVKQAFGEIFDSVDDAKEYAETFLLKQSIGTFSILLEKDEDISKVSEKEIPF